MVGVDAIGPIKLPNQDDKYILVAVDYLTRWPIAQVVSNMTQETTADFLMNQLVIVFGVPSYILSDRGSNFMSGYVREFLKELGCRHLTNTAYRPQTNGLCERMNQTIVQTLSKLVRDADDLFNWDRYLGPTLLSMRTTPNDATKYSPAMLLFGYELSIPSTWPPPDLISWKENSKRKSPIRCESYNICVITCVWLPRKRLLQGKSKIRRDTICQSHSASISESVNRC